MGAISRFPKKMSLLFRVATSCGASRRDQFRLWVCGIVLYLCDLLPLQPKFNVKVHLSGREIELQVGSFGDYTTLEEIFIEQVYEIPDTFKPRAIVDLGSNIGIGIAYFALRYPQARIWAYEPDPNNWKRLQVNVSRLQQVQFAKVAVAAETGTAQFSTDRHRGTSSGLIREVNAQSVTVETQSLDRILENIGLPQIDLVKFDIEGAEYEVFESFTRWERVRAFSGELHKVEVPGAPEGLCALFKDRGYEVDTQRDRMTGIIHVLALAGQKRASGAVEN